MFIWEGLLDIVSINFNEDIGIVVVIGGDYFFLVLLGVIFVFCILLCDDMLIVFSGVFEICYLGDGYIII